jgi:transposase
VRRNKNNPADAAAICEAVSRPSMRFVATKTEAQQAAAGIRKVREMLIKQRTMLINTLLGLMAEFGIVVTEGPHHVDELLAILADPADQRIPTPLHEGLLAIVETLCGLKRRIQLGQFQGANKRCSLIGHCLDRVTRFTARTRHAGIVEQDDRDDPERSRSAIAGQHCPFPA